VSIVAEMELQEASEFQMAGDPNRALDLVRSIHAQLPERPRSPMESRLISQFRIAAIDLTVRAYQALAAQDQMLRSALEDALRDYDRDDPQLDTALDRVLKRARALVEQARQASRESDPPMVHALVAAKMEGLETDLTVGLLQSLGDRMPDQEEAASGLSQRLRDQDISERPRRFDMLRGLLASAVEHAATPSDVLTLDTLVTDPVNFKRCLPAGSDMQAAAEALVGLQGIHACLQMKQHSDTMYTTLDRR